MKHPAGLRALRNTLVPLVAVLASSAAMADRDTTIYSGAGCQPAYASDLGRLSYGTGNKVSNISDRSVYVVCPVNRDKKVTRWDRWVPWANDRHPTRDISCVLRVYAYGTGKLLASTSYRTSGVGRNIHYVVNPSSQHFALANYAMRCSLPPRTSTGKTSSLDGYMLVEADPGFSLYETD